MKALKVLVAPDYRHLAPYQTLLGDALRPLGVESEYYGGTRRGLPLTRAVWDRNLDLVHLHWIEQLVHGKQRSVLRRLRLVPDMRFAARRTPFVYTAHDLFPTGWPETALNRWLVHGVLHSSAALIVHSAGAREIVCDAFGFPPERCALIPHGDQTPTYGPPMSRREARNRLGLGEGKYCMAFGTLQANKGVAQLVEWWARTRPAGTLLVVGNVYDQPMARRMEQLVAEGANIELHFGFQADSQVNAWFSAVDCVVTNYQTIFTSGVACLARSWGVPILLPSRLTTIDLLEPDPAVIRYTELEVDFEEYLHRAYATPPDYERGTAWRAATSWDTVASRTVEIYRRVLDGRSPGDASAAKPV